MTVDKSDVLLVAVIGVGVYLIAKMSQGEAATIPISFPLTPFETETKQQGGAPYDPEYEPSWWDTWVANNPYVLS